jgi:hypothetical protein
MTKAARNRAAFPVGCGYLRLSLSFPVDDDLVERAAILEMRLLRLLPTAELLFDRERPERLELVCMLCERARIARTQMMLRDDLLRRRGVQIFQVSLSYIF